MSIADHRLGARRPTGKPASAGRARRGDYATVRTSLNDHVYNAPNRGWIKATLILLVVGAAVVGGMLGYNRLTAPSAAATPSKVGTAQLVTAATGAGVLYRSTAGHFTARFPKRPIESDPPPTRQSGITSTVHSATDTSTDTLVAAIDLSSNVAVPAAFLSGVLRGVSSSGALRLDHESATTFGGHPARMGTYSSSTNLAMTGIAVLYGPRRAYVMVAASGSSFAALTKSFAALG